MPPLLETVTGYQTASTTTAGTYTAFTAQNGQSFTVRSSDSDPAGVMFAPFGSFGAAGYAQIKSARMHDNNIGTTFAVAANSAFPQVSEWAGDEYDEPIWNVDTLTVQSTTVASQTASTSYLIGLQMYYQNLGSATQRMMTPAQVSSYSNPQAKVGDHYVSWVRPASSGTAGVLGTGVAINATNDQFYADGFYALVGYLCPTSVGAVLISGIDTSNVLVGGPGSSDPLVTRSYFLDLSMRQNSALVPVIKANNKAGTLVYVADPATTSTTFTIGLIWVYLGSQSGNTGLVA
jgi:hypothetical protein